VPSEPIIFVVDDDAAVRESLVMLLKLNGYAVEAYESAASFLASNRASARGCLIADIRMPDMDGLELQRELTRLQSPLQGVVITGHGDVPLSVQAMKAGAVDFLEKPFARDALLAAVRYAIERIAQTAQSNAAADEVRKRIALLTKREREVFDHVVLGKQSKVIAFDLGASPRTIEIHRARMMSKMQAGSLQELVRLAIAAKSSA
jgi:two-component system response regulator FixJ